MPEPKIRVPGSRNDRIFPQIRIASATLRRFQAAARMLADPAYGNIKGLTFSRFVRDVLEDASAEVFELYGPPEEWHLYRDKWKAYKGRVKK